MWVPVSFAICLKFENLSAFLSVIGAFHSMTPHCVDFYFLQVENACTNLAYHCFQLWKNDAALKEFLKTVPLGR